MPRILLVEDDASIVASLKEYLLKEGFDVASASGQSEAVSSLAKLPFDLLLVDLNLSDGDGFGVFEKANEAKIPVIFLTASDDENNIVKGFDVGADDYITKPFRPRELVSRIKNILRRSGSHDAVTILGGNVTVDTDKGIVAKNGNEVFLSALEYKLLLVFLSNRGRLLSRNLLLEEIWDIAGDFVNDNTLTVYIKRQREKI